MFTFTMYDRLSEWLANLSLLLLGTIVLPAFFKVDKLTFNQVISGVSLSILSLWFSLRIARMAGKTK